MVVSRVNSKVEHREAQEINESDWNHASSVFKIEIEEKSVVVLLGKANFELDKLIYFRIYLLSMDNMVEGQIGVFEVANYSEDEEERRDVLAHLFDEDKDPNIHVFEEPLLFYFAKQLVQATATTSESYLIAYNAAVDKDNAAAAAAASAQAPPADSALLSAVAPATHAAAAAAEDPATPTPPQRSIVFFLDRNSAQDKFPGEGQHERIERDQMLDYRVLIEHIKKHNWRRMLHDSWDEAPGSPFEVDGKKWKSVVHYVEACKFEKEHPDMYAKFAMTDRDTNISKYVDLALSAASPSGVHEYNDARRENILLRTSDITFDKDYRREDCRAKALFAKFSQCAILKMLLKATDKATLLVRKQLTDAAAAEELVPDNELMTLRDKLSP